MNAKPEWLEDFNSRVTEFQGKPLEIEDARDTLVDCFALFLSGEHVVAKQPNGMVVFCNDTETGQHRWFDIVVTERLDR